VVGTIGIILAVIMVVDQVDDVITYLTWSPDDWRRIFAPEVADLIVRAMPPLAWLVVSAAVGIGLGLLLFVGSIFLRRRRRNGVTLCCVRSRGSRGTPGSWPGYRRGCGRAMRSSGS
jgi:hypothetical protein